MKFYRIKDSLTTSLGRKLPSQPSQQLIPFYGTKQNSPGRES